jgi:glycosyltransferase involved in cell wall biosynthesis
MRTSVIVPTFNGATRIGACLDALVPQVKKHAGEILVVNDGSTDQTAVVAATYPGVIVLDQPNAGPAAARNHGAMKAIGDIILFTDDDCVPTSAWLSEMLRPFVDPEVIGVKGVYRTDQESIVARFVQIEYEDKYRLVAKRELIDFVDTYSAAFRRSYFLATDGYDASFPVACAEDVELSYRMSARGWKMKFAPKAVVCHIHPNSLANYLKKKYKFAYWRVFAVRKNPEKAIADSHTPQLMKLQLLFFPALLFAVVLDRAVRPYVPFMLLVLIAFLISTVPFSLRAMGKDFAVGVLSPVFLALRSGAQFLGTCAGVCAALRKPLPIRTDSIYEQKPTV